MMIYYRYRNVTTNTLSTHLKYLPNIFLDNYIHFVRSKTLRRRMSLYIDKRHYTHLARLINHFAGIEEDSSTHANYSCNSEYLKKPTDYTTCPKLIHPPINPSNTPYLHPTTLIPTGSFLFSG